MKFSYDSEVDAMYLDFQQLADGAAEARPLTDGVITNFGPDGRLAGLETLDASLVLGQVEGSIIVAIAPPVTVSVAGR